MNPLASIWDDLPTPPVKEKKVKPPPIKVDHSVARKIYEEYLVKRDILRQHQEYALRVAKATEGPSMTPVKPLATMGCNGGALLCDHCGKPIILEGGRFHNVPVDVAWAQNPLDNWISYIKGGLMVRIVDNGTLRIYHGYDNVPDHCCTLAKAKMDAEEASFKMPYEKIHLVAKLVSDEFGNDNRLLSDIVTVMLSFDPGFGVNRP